MSKSDRDCWKWELKKEAIAYNTRLARECYDFPPDVIAEKSIDPIVPPEIDRAKQYLEFYQAKTIAP